MEHIGILGGSFDPIHIGHLITALSVFEKRKLTKLIFMPCFISPHKVGYDITDAFQRLEMVRLATEDFPQFEVSDFEISKHDISFTVDTLKHFKKDNPSIDLIIGFDNLISFDNWKEPETITELANLVVLKRNNFASYYSLHNFFEKAIFVDSPIIEVSSTLIRDRIKNGLSFKYFVHNKVYQYIMDNKLYMR